MDPRSEVVLRQLKLFTDDMLLVGLPADDLLSKIPRAIGWTWLASDLQALNHHYNDRVYLGVAPPSIMVEAAILFLPKSKELTHYLLQILVHQLGKQRKLYLVGEKRAGVERAAKQLAVYGKTIKLDSARHCQLWQLTIEQTIPKPHINDFNQSYIIDNLTVHSLAGVFSHGRLDAGTQLLIQHLDHLPTGNILDFGCGSGIIGSLLKQKYPQSTIYFQDVDAFAIASTQQTLAINQLEGVTILGDGVNAAPDKLNAIITNPPFHQGIQTHYHTTEQLLHEAVNHLLIGGELRLVANSFLKYQPIIEHAFNNCQVLTETNGFKVYKAVKLTI